MNRTSALVLPALAALLALFFTQTPARAQDREFHFGLGYSHLFWDGHNSDALSEQGGARFEGRVSWCPDQARLPALRVGAGLSFTGFYSYDSDDDFVVVDDIVFFTADDFSQLSLITPEAEVSYRLDLPDDRWYFEPGLAASFFVGNYVKGEEVIGYVDTDIDRWNVGGGGRAFLRLAYRPEPRFAIGLEGSYSFGWIDFGDDIGGDIQQGYLGFYIAHKF